MGLTGLYTLGCYLVLFLTNLKISDNESLHTQRFWLSFGRRVMFSYEHFALHVEENFISFYVCILKKFHLLLLSRELNATQSIKSSDRCLCATLFQ